MSVDPMQKFGKGNMGMAMTAFGAWAKNAQAIATEVADYSKKSFEDSAAAFEKLIGAKSLEKGDGSADRISAIVVRRIGRRDCQDRRAVRGPREGSLQAVRKRADEDARDEVTGGGAALYCVGIDLLVHRPIFYPFRTLCLRPVAPC